MTTISGEWKVEELPDPDSHGRRQVVIHETILGTDDEGRKWGPMPGSVSEAFIRIRRERLAKLMSIVGGTRILTN